MKRTILALLPIAGAPAFGQVTIPDPNFAYTLQVLVPFAMSGNILDETHPDVLALDYLNLNFVDSTNWPITDLTGIEHFTGLEWLYSDMHPIDTIPALPPALTSLTLDNSTISTLPPLPVGLNDIRCHGCLQLTSLPALPGSMTSLALNGTGLTSLPALPASLVQLQCEYSPLASLPSLPPALTHLYCEGSQLTTLPTLPATLLYLYCRENNITALPALPSSLEYLRCDGNNLVALPALPNGLENLLCYGNPLTALPALPDSLKALSCGYNSLSSLPPLPAGLVGLNVGYAQFTALPTLPPGLDVLSCWNNPLASLPDLPPSLTNLNFNNCTALNCVPVLPQGLQYLYGFGSGLSCLPNIPPAAAINLDFAPVVCDPGTSPCPVASALVMGTVFNDVNGNGLRDGGEPALTGPSIGTLPPVFQCGVGADGRYALPVDTGTWTVDGTDLLYHVRTTLQHTVAITAAYEVDSLNDVGYQAIPDVYDLVSTLTVGAARPGFDNTAWLQVENIGTEVTAATIEFNFDADQSWLSATPPPDLLSGTTATWNLPSLAVASEWSAVVELNTGVGVPLGTPINASLSALPAFADTTPANNTMDHSSVVVGSFDPNDKLVEPGTLHPAEVLAGARVEYIIRFQNTGTYPAERVKITDVLSTDLVPGSFAFIASSHACSWTLQEGLLTFLFDPIALPDSASDPLGSQGFVRFSMEVSTALTVGDSVTNAADIFFDFNAPVHTADAVVVVELGTQVREQGPGLMGVLPNPAHDAIMIIGARSAIAEVRILAADGREVQQAHSVAGPLRIDALAPGSYVVLVSCADGTIDALRFVKH